MSRAVFQTALVFLATLLVVGCSSDTSKTEEAKIREELPLGSSSEKVESYLTNRNIEHSSDLIINQIGAIVRHVGGDGIVQKDLSLTFQFDAQHNLTAIQTQPVYTGP